MIRLLTAALLVASFSVVADTEVPHVFEGGTPALAAEVNANFDTLEAQIDSDYEDFEQFQVDVDAALPPSDCTTNQIIRWNGSEWVCDDDPLANLNCTDGQSLIYQGGAIDCVCSPPGTAISDANFYVAINDYAVNGAASPYGDIALWCTGNVTRMEQAFTDAYRLDANADISAWDTRNVTNMAYMFYDAESFNQDLSNWDASSVTNCLNFASGATAWLNAYGGSIAGKNPPLSASLIAAGCSE